MKIKKYVVREMQEAMQLIREDLGPDAVIISSYPLPRKNLRDFFNPRQLEVTAALDDSGDLLFKAPSPEQKQFSSFSRRFLPAGEEKYPAQFNHLLKQREFGMNYLENWEKRLRLMEVEERVIRTLLRDLPAEAPDAGACDPDEYVGLLLKTRIVAWLTPVYQKEQKPNLCFFTGPTGAGKTYTVAKLAARMAALEQKRVALISVVTGGRWQAVEELKMLTRPASVPVEAVTTPEELAAAVRSQTGKDAILIDTEGLPSPNASRMLELKGFLDVVDQPKEVFLVLNCLTRNRDLYRAIDDFNRLNFTGLILTRLDETQTYGSLLNAVCYAARPVVYAGCGLAVPDDLRPVDPPKLAEILLQGAREVHERGFEINL